MVVKNIVRIFLKTPQIFGLQPDPKKTRLTMAIGMEIRILNDCSRSPFRRFI